MVGADRIPSGGMQSPLSASGPTNQLVEGLGLSLAEIDALTGDDPLVAKTLDEISEELGLSGVPNLFRALALNPEELRATWQRFKTHLLAGHFPILVKLTVGLALAREANCDYMRRLLGHLLFLYGADPKLLHFIWQGEMDKAIGLLPEDEQPLARMLVELAGGEDCLPKLSQRLTQFGASERMELMFAVLTLKELIQVAKGLGVPADLHLTLQGSKP